MSRARVTLSFQTAHPKHRQVYDALMCLPPGVRSEYAIDLIVSALDDDRMYQLLLRALRDYQPQLQPTQPQESEVGLIPQDMIDFVFSLEKDA